MQITVAGEVEFRRGSPKIRSSAAPERAHGRKPLQEERKMRTGGTSRVYLQRQNAQEADYRRR